jgi:divinyl chlorophyllide a 8-vinyl-reductase
MSSSVSFFDRRGNVVIPTALSIIKPRRGVFALTIALAEKAVMLSAEACAPGVPELPGGGIEERESLDEAIAREWSEEVGIPFNVTSPLQQFHHVRGFYSDERDEFWIYDQTFRLYHFLGSVELGKKWRNSEGGLAGWEPIASLPKLHINRAHWCAIPALLSDAAILEHGVNIRSVRPRRVFVLGSTGTIGRATVAALVERGHEVVCFVRPKAGAGGALSPDDSRKMLAGATVRFGNVQDPESLAREGVLGEGFDAFVSCMASRTGDPADAWAVDYQAQVNALAAARRAGVSQFLLLSAICVQKPVLEFQRAKLAFEQRLIESGITYSIVRPTAFFKSLSGQVERLRRGKPFLLFGDGTLTACKPISDRDLAIYLADCLDDENRWNRVLPIGGPGEALTPRQQGEQLFALLGRAPRFRRVPVAMLNAIIGVLSAAGRFVPSLAKKAELARIGRFYATESMLVLNQKTGLYDALATPSTGTETLFEFYARLVNGESPPERGDHAVF